MSAADEIRMAYSPAETAELLGLGLTLVKDLLRTGQLRSRKVGGRRIVSRRAIEEFLAES